MASERVELLQGTLDLIVLRALSTMGPQHAYGLAARLAQVSDHPLSLNQGTLYPALVRLEQKGWIKGAWQKTETNREAKFYALTKAGEKALRKKPRSGAGSRASSTNSCSSHERAYADGRAARRPSARAPRFGSQDHQHGDHLEPADPHRQRQHDAADRMQVGEVAPSARPG